MKKGTIPANAPTQRILINFDEPGEGGRWDQIQAFRTFQISSEYQERFGYPAITQRVREKIFGKNAAVPYGIDQREIQRLTASDFVSQEKLAYQENPQPNFLTYGPKTKREFLNLLKWGG